MEDSEADAELVLNELQKGGYDPIHERVDTFQAMAAALDRQAWDVVISDYTMPGFGGAAALELLRSRGLDVPFISVSGTIGEEIAVSMMKAGAHDYVLKDNLTRLVPAIERELKAAAARRDSKHAEDRSRLLAAIVDSSDDAITSQTVEGMILTWNHAAERMFGYKAEEIVGKPVSVLVPLDRPNELGDILGKLLHGEPVRHYESSRVHKDGRHVPVSLTLSPLKDSMGRVIGVSSVARDISDRRMEEVARMQLIEELTDALQHVKTLTGLLPICAWCKKIRDDRGYWQQLETYITQHSSADFTHGICPECSKRVRPAS